MSERLGRWVFGLVVRRLQPHLLSDAHPRPGGHAAARLHLPAGDGLGRHQPVRQPERAASSPPASCCSSSTPSRSVRRGRAGRRQSLGCADARMGDRPRRRPPTISRASRWCSSADPLWDEPDVLPVASGLRVDRRELVVTQRRRGAAGGARDPRRATRSGRSGRASPRRVMLICLDLHALGGGLGRDPDRDRADRLVLAEGHAGGRGVRQTRRCSTSPSLPLHGMGSASLTWWGTLGFMLLEGTGFALVIGDLSLSRQPRAATGRSARRRPICWPGTLVTLVLLASVVPNHADRRAGRSDRTCARSASASW